MLKKRFYNIEAYKTSLDLLRDMTRIFMNVRIDVKNFYGTNIIAKCSDIISMVRIAYNTTDIRVRLENLNNIMDYTYIIGDILHILKELNLITIKDNASLGKHLGSLQLQIEKWIKVTGK